MFRNALVGVDQRPGGRDELAEHRGADLLEARERISALGDVEPQAACGVGTEEIALYGAFADLRIVGSRGYGPIGRLMQGSTSQRLAHTARCPLLVLTRVTASSEDAAPAADERETVGAATS